MKDSPSLTSLDKLIGWISPERGLRRMQARTRMAVAGGYKASDRDRAAFRNQGISSGSADAESLPWLDVLRSDSRDLLRKAPLAIGAVNTVVTNVVGTGLMPQSITDRDVLRSRAGLTDEKIDQFERQAEREFTNWANSIFCDASRTQTFRGLQSLAFRSTLESGDVFALKIQKKNPRGRIDLATKLIEADRVRNPSGAADTNEVAGGVRRDGDGAPIAYCVLQSHPGNYYTNLDRKTVDIPAFMANGQRQVLHLFTRLRPEQTRGVPYLASVIEPLLQLNQYTEAELQAAVVSSLFTVFVKTEDGEGIAPPAAGSSANKNSSLALGTGTILDLAPGEDVAFADPSRPNQAFDPFVLSILRQIGVALELPFEILIKHFTASYSAAQAAIVEAWKFFKERRAWLVDMFCQPLYEAVLYEAIAKGFIDAPGFFSDPIARAAYLGADWIGPPRGSIDQRKEAEANSIMEDRGWRTSSEITAEITGGDWDLKHERRAKEHQKRVAAGLQSPVAQLSPEPPPSDNNP